jgi:hypothetical protein
MTAPLTPDDLAAPRRRHQPETPPQHAERLRVLAERSAPCQAERGLAGGRALPPEEATG